MASTYSYRVTSQVPSTGQGPDGRYGPGVTVSIRTDASGLSGSVFIPDSQYDPAQAAKVLASLAYRLEEVHKLTGKA